MRILVIPDCQVKQGVDLSYLDWVGKYIVDKRPDVVVQIGDFADMPSLSTYDKGKKSFEGRRYREDIEAAHHGMGILLGPMWRLQTQQRKSKKAVYQPRMVLTLGNHEERILRAINDDPKLDGTIGLSDLKYEEYGWEVYPFLEPVVIEGVVFVHYLPSGVMNKPVTSASMLLTKGFQSIVCGHQQTKQIATARRADGKRITGIIAGACYTHDEDYMGKLGNKHWRGVVLLNEVEDGEYDEMFVSLTYLQRKYG